MAEAIQRSEGNAVDWTPTAAVTAGEVLQVSDGRAAFAPTAIAAGKLGSLQVSGIVEVEKTASMVVVKGSRLYWDHSANKAHLNQVNDRDFYLGIAQEDATAAGTTVKVALNADPRYTISLGDGFVTAPVVTAGINHQVIGHAEGVTLALDTTAEAQKMDALSVRGVAVSTPCLVDLLICINTNGDDAAVDFNVGLASGTHASDADTITESLFCHIDGASLNINLESDDGTTEVAATDTTVDAVAGTPFLVQFDLRDNSDIQCYIDGVAVLTGSTFDLSAATGPLKLLAHLEKSSNDSPGNFTVMRAGIRTFEE